MTTPQRMLVDLAAVVDRETVTRAVEQCVVSRLLSIATIRTELERLPARGRRGVAPMRKVLADWPLGDTRPDSILDVIFGRLCRATGLPVARFQNDVTVGGRPCRLDAAYPDVMLAIEVDGFGCRTDRAVFQDERSRQNDLV